MKKKTYLTELVCLNCGNIDIIQRLYYHKKSIGHIKDLWCYKCKEKTKNYEIKDKNLFYFYNNDDPNTLYVKSMLWPEVNHDKVKKIEKL